MSFDGEPRRMDDKIVIELKQKFLDFLERYDRDQRSINDRLTAQEKKSENWRESLEQRIQPWEDFVKSVNMGWKLVIGFAAAVGIVYKGVSWALGHVKWNG